MSTHNEQHYDAPCGHCMTPETYEKQRATPEVEERAVIKLVIDAVWEATDGGVKLNESQFYHWEELNHTIDDFLTALTTKHQAELGKAVEAIEEEMRNVYSTMLREFVNTGLATEEQWNDSISPAMKRLGNVVRGLPPDAVTARVYKYPKQTYCNGEPCICGDTPTKTDKTTEV